MKLNFFTSSSERVEVFWSSEEVSVFSEAPLGSNLYTSSVLFSFKHRLRVLFLSVLSGFVFGAEPAPPRSLYAVNATHSSVTLLWTEEGVVDHYQVLCRPNKASKEFKVKLLITRLTI